jgi:DNA polymerase III subunit delta'
VVETQRASASAESPPAAPTASDSPWTPLIKAAESAGEEAEEATRRLLDEETEAGVKRSAKDITDEAKRAGRRRRTETLDLALELSASWFRDLAATASGAQEVVYNQDCIVGLESRASDLDPARPRRAAELVQDTRRRLDLNVSEELALEALAFRLQRIFA